MRVSHTWESQLVLSPGIQTGLGLLSQPRSWHKRSWKGRGRTEEKKETKCTLSLGAGNGGNPVIRPNGEPARGELGAVGSLQLCSSSVKPRGMM